MWIVLHVITRPLHVRKKSLVVTSRLSAAVGGGGGLQQRVPDGAWLQSGTFLRLLSVTFLRLLSGTFLRLQSFTFLTLRRGRQVKRIPMV